MPTGSPSGDFGNAPWEADLLGMAAGPVADTPAVAGAPQVEGFEIIGRLGSGASGEVWLAEDLDTERTVALKILRGAGATASEEQLQREVRILAKLIHPNLVLLHRGIVTEDGRHGLAMEWIDGWPLDEWLEAHPDLTPTEKLELFRGIVKGVAFLHDHGVIHRDLKPANVIVDAEGVPKIVDFGLARLHQEETATGMDGGSIGVAGTLHFMAPEQAANGRGSRAMPVDVYALGLLFHRILTGEWLRPPEDTPAETLARVLRPPPLVLEGAARQLPADLKSILHQALSPDPARRYHHARDLDADLTRFGLKQPVAARKHTLVYLTSTFLRRQARRSAVAAGLVLCGLVAGGSMYHRHRTIAARNEANLKHAYALTSFALSQLRDELRTGAPVGEQPPAYEKDAFGSASSLPVNAEGELDMRYYQALLADLRSATSEGHGRYQVALKSIQTALDLYTKLAKEAPDDPKRLLDAARARLGFARLLERTERWPEVADQTRKTLQQMDRLAAWPGFDSAPLLPMRCDALGLLARHASHKKDHAAAVGFARQMLAACEALPDELLVRAENEAVPRLAQAAYDLAGFALAAGPSCLPEVRVEIERATASSRDARDKSPKSRPLAWGLARCLHAKARLSLHEGPGTDMESLMREAAALLTDPISPNARTPRPLIWELSQTAAAWAESVQEHPDLKVTGRSLDLAQGLLTHLVRKGHGSQEVLVQRARIGLYQSRYDCRRGKPQEAARHIGRSVAVLRQWQARDPERTGLTLLTAAALRQAKELADFPEAKWSAELDNQLQTLLTQLVDKESGLSAEEQRELASLRAAIVMK